MIVVSNSSPLIALALINQLELLPALYDKIHIARAIRSEVVTKGKGRAGAAGLAKARWLVVTPVSCRALATLRHDHQDYIREKSRRLRWHCNCARIWF